MNFIPTNLNTLESADRPPNPNLLSLGYKLTAHQPLRATQMKHGLETSSSINTDLASLRTRDIGHETSLTQRKPLEKW